MEQSEMIELFNYFGLYEFPRNCRPITLYGGCTGNGKSIPRILEEILWHRDESEKKGGHTDASLEEG